MHIPTIESLNNSGIQKKIVEEFGFDPYDLVFNHISKSTVETESKAYINLASNDYLGLATDARVIEASAAAIEQYGTSTCGTPVATGSTKLAKELEKELSSFCGLQATVLFPSCFQANTALFTSIVGKEDVVVVDHQVHASLVQGIRSTNCKIKPFRHNDCDHLEKLLKKCDVFRQIFVVTDSVFSTDGSICPLNKIVALCSEYGATPVVDDSHGLGVIGKSGGGVLDYFGIDDFKGIYTASLGKALANSGGMVSGTEGLIDYLKYSCLGLIYSTALIPASLAGTKRVLEILANEFHVLNEQLRDNRLAFVDALLKRGYMVVGGEAPIISIFCGSKHKTVELAKRFFDNGVATTPFIEPSVPPGKGVVRMIPRAGISTEDCLKVIDAISRIDPVVEK